MSTPPPPPRLTIEFAPDAHVAVIIRRGPTRWSQLVSWDLKKDTFEPGQWLKGRVTYATLSPNGRYLAMGIQGNKDRRPLFREREYTLVSRPPYFTALAIQFKSLTLSGIGFTATGDLIWTDPDQIEYRTHRKPAFRVFDKVTVSTERLASFEVGQNQWLLPNGRRFITRSGCVYELLDDREKLLFDANKEEFREVETPEWARNW